MSRRNPTRSSERSHAALLRITTTGVADRPRARWQIPSSISPGEVRLRFRIDRGGSAHGIQLVSSDDSHLGDTCLAAFRHASPFPPPPKEIHYLVGKGILATFRHGDDL